MFDAKKSGVTGLAFLGLAVFMAVGCAKPPTKEMTEAESSVQAAQASGAEEYANMEFRTAQDVLADAKAKMESKDYQGAKMAALDAKVKGDQAKSSADANKATVKTQAETLVTDLKAVVEGIKAAAAKAKGKNGAKAKAEAATLDTNFAAAQQAVEAGQYSSAVTQLQGVQTKSDELKALLGIK
ncbi:MAG TPA: DUF4398 domain-containing protein [Elusimicrobiota bacterium]|nr:DUF4398 domain-containing protein [Elusimicrobiota bacterium]